jgi:hypothetical protein
LLSRKNRRRGPMKRTLRMAVACCIVLVFASATTGMAGAKGEAASMDRNDTTFVRMAANTDLVDKSSNTNSNANKNKNANKNLNKNKNKNLNKEQNANKNVNKNENKNRNQNLNKNKNRNLYKNRNQGPSSGQDQMNFWNLGWP